MEQKKENKDEINNEDKKKLIQSTKYQPRYECYKKL